MQSIWEDHTEIEFNDKYENVIQTEEIEKEFKEVIAKNKYFESNKFFYGTLSDLMQGKKINADAFTPFADSKTTKEKITLGKVLFSSTSLSKSNNLKSDYLEHLDRGANIYPFLK